MARMLAATLCLTVFAVPARGQLSFEQKLSNVIGIQETTTQILLKFEQQLNELRSRIAAIEPGQANELFKSYQSLAAHILRLDTGVRELREDFRQLQQYRRASGEQQAEIDRRLRSVELGILQSRTKANAYAQSEPVRVAAAYNAQTYRYGYQPNVVYWTSHGYRYVRYGYGLWPCPRCGDTWCPGPAQ